MESKEDKEFKESIGKMLEAFVDIEEKESQEMVVNSFKKIQSLGYDLSDPENFNTLLMYQMKKGMKAIAKTMHKEVSPEINDKSKPDFIYLNYGFLESNISKLCVLRDGSACCVDKSRTIINMYLKYSLTGNIPEFNPDVEHYWIPKFGTYKEWMNFCDGLYMQFYGKPNLYLESYSALIKAEKRKYKHILHSWYIKFKDGNEIKFDNSWDENDNNPLDNKYYDKGEYYLIQKEYVADKNYEPYKDKKMLWDIFCKVPKADIEKIYKISEERMV